MMTWSFDLPHSKDDHDVPPAAALVLVVDTVAMAVGVNCKFLQRKLVTPFLSAPTASVQVSPRWWRETARLVAPNPLSMDHAIVLHEGLAIFAGLRCQLLKSCCTWCCIPHVAFLGPSSRFSCVVSAALRQSEAQSPSEGHTCQWLCSCGTWGRTRRSPWRTKWPVMPLKNLTSHNPGFLSHGEHVSHDIDLVAALCHFQTRNFVLMSCHKAELHEDTLNFLVLTSSSKIAKFQLMIILWNEKLKVVG